MNRTVLAVAGVAAASIALAAGCTPGSNSKQPEDKPESSVSTDVAKAGNVTLTVWDQEVRGGQNEAMTQLNKEFQEEYPNVEIKRVSKEFTNLKDSLKLALSGKNPPDVVQANQGYGDMGAYVKAGYLQPLTTYSDVYGWPKRYSKTLLDLNSFTKDGKTIGDGNLYGISQVGEVVGLFYNKEKLKAAGLSEPKTWDEFTEQLAELKAKGEQPIMFGNKDQYPAIHTYGVLQARNASKQDITETVFGRGDHKWDTSANVKAAATLQDWAKKGYLSKGANGLSYDQAAADFGKGKGVYLMTGSWLGPDLTKTMEKNVGFIPPPPAKAGQPAVTTGGGALPWSITSKSKNPDVAAAYLNFITNSHAADVVTESGGIPVTTPASAEPKPGTVQEQLLTSWNELKSGNLVPYLDYTTPTFYDTTSVQLQQVIGGQTTPKACMRAFQKDYGEFMDKQ